MIVDMQNRSPKIRWLRRALSAVSASLAFSLAPLGLSSCDEDIEGNEPGECEDGADNDSDGYFDCEDRDC